MSDYAYVSDRAKKVFASVSRLESELARNPNSHSIQINLTSMRRMADQARKELERLAAINSIEVCNYRIVPEGGYEYAVEFVSKSLLTYQYLFSQIYDAMRNGKKVKAQIGREAAQESAMVLAYTYSGSLGVALLVQSDKEFFAGSLDRPIDALFQILDIDNIDTVKDVAASLGRAVVTRIHEWSSANVQGGFSADIRWKRSDGRLLGQMVDRRRLERIVEYIGSASDVQTEQTQIRGMLVGGSLASRSFHIAIQDGQSYTGHLADNAELPDDITLGRIYDAQIDVARTEFYATDKTVTTYTLRRLRGPVSEVPFTLE